MKAAPSSAAPGRPCTTHSRRMFEGIDDAEYAALIATLHKMLSNIRRHDI